MQDKRFPVLQHERNPFTHEEHRREVFLQVTLPLIIGGLIIGLLCALPVITVSGGGDVGDWASISLIFLIILVGFASLIPLAIFGGLAYGVTRLLKVTPAAFYRMQLKLEKLSIQIQNISNRAVRPFFKAGGISAQVSTLGKSVKNLSPSQWNIQDKETEL